MLRWRGRVAGPALVGSPSTASSPRAREGYSNPPLIRGVGAWLRVAATPARRPGGCSHSTGRREIRWRRRPRATRLPGPGPTNTSTGVGYLVPSYCACVRLREKVGSAMRRTPAARSRLANSSEGVGSRTSFITRARGQVHTFRRLPRPTASFTDRHWEGRRCRQSLGPDALRVASLAALIRRMPLPV
jgi:hypothetical protein